MSRMRLMQGDEAGATALVCLYCGAQAESKPPYAVIYCHCRSDGAERGDATASRHGAAR